MPSAGIGTWLPPAIGRDPIPVHPDGSGAPAAAAASAGLDSFTSALADAVGQVEADQRAAGGLASKLAAGQVSDVAEVTIAAEKAYLSLATLVQVRNKLLEAYQEFMRMQI